MFIELHILQNFAPSNLNRDESNNPKDCVFGGVRRARISSQCIKRSIRSHPAFKEETGVELASRTRFLANAVSSRLQSAGIDEAEADKAAQDLVGKILGGMDSKNKAQSKVLFFASKEEMDILAEGIFENWDALHGSDSGTTALDKIASDFRKVFQNRTSAPEIAMFGRMLADDPKLNLDAASQVAHAISTHRANMEFDFFTAVDDLQKDEDTGAAMMGVVGYNAATFYRYSNIDFGQLLKNLNGDIELARKTVKGFLKASALAIPTGKQNSFAAQNPPSFLLAVVRRAGSTWSMANAFEKPVAAYGETSPLVTSIEALDSYWGNLQSFFEDPAVPFAAMIATDAKLKNLSPRVMPNFNAWIEGVMAEIERG
jgi:CRISPR system Cascade subunit CasC